jgi:hypothetical protein
MPSINSSSSSIRSRHASLLAGLVAAALAAGPADAQLTQLAQSVRDFDRDLPATMTALPALLSQTGLYKNIGNKATRALTDTNAIVAFEVNSALWSDGSHKERFISLPPGSAKVTPTDTGKYIFPDNTVLIKNFAVDTIYGDSTSRIYVETRFLVYQSTATEKKWSGFTYRWRRNQSDAELVNPENYLDTTILVKLNGKTVGKRWHYPSTMDCAQCHRGEEEMYRGSLGFITPQLNRMIGGVNQLQRLVTKNVLASNPIAGKTNPHRWYGLKETSATAEQRVRSYFASNCSHCHGNGVLWGQAEHNFDYFNATKPITFPQDSIGGWVNKEAKSGGEFPYLVRPGYPDSSLILAKMLKRQDEPLATVTPEQMPPIATSQVDSAALILVREWICSLKTGGTCQAMAWLPDDVNWDDELVSIRGRFGFRGSKYQARIHAGMLSLPAALASGTVELRDSQGRSVALRPAGSGQFRLPSDLKAGAYLLRAGTYTSLLQYLP